MTSAALTSATQPDQDRKGPGRPRSARVDEAIVAAVIELLLDGVTAEALSIESVATRAGVGKATIYRRWPNKDALLLDVVATFKGPLPQIRGESLRADLLALLAPVGTSARPVPTGPVLPCLISELRRSPSLRQVYQRTLEPRRELMRQVLRRGITTGELRADLDIEAVMAMLVGPLLAKSLLDWDPELDRHGLPERLLDAIWPAIASR